VNPSAARRTARSPNFSPSTPAGNCRSAKTAHIPVSARPIAPFETANASMSRGMSGLMMTRANIVQKNDDTATERTV